MTIEGCLVYQGNMTCMYSEKGLDLDAAIRLLEHIEEHPVINVPPQKPRGGEVFIFLPDSVDEQENYKCDQYRWLNSGPKDIPRKNPLVKKQYFIGKLPNGKTQAFQKHCYILVSDTRNPYPVLIHYIGDETVMVDYPHGNSKKSTNAYFAIAPSVRKDIANKSRVSMPSAILSQYRKDGILGYDHDTPIDYKEANPVLTPRNKSQVRNIRRKQKLSTVKYSLPKEDMATLHSIGTELVGFCHYIRTYPELACIVGLNEITIEVGHLLKLTNNLVVFSFQETYKVGRYFITPFNFIHCAFSEQPTIPCFFLISESNDFFLFEKLLRTAIDSIPGLEGTHTAVVTNQEYNFTASLGVVFPEWIQVYEWECLFVAARTYLRKLNTDIKDISWHIKQLKALMSCETVEVYRQELNRLHKEWSPHFMEYYMQILRESVETRLGRWQLDRYKLFSSHTGVLRAMSPDLQLVIKHLQELKEVSLDIILPSLYHVQNFLYVMLQKGFCGTGQFILSHQFQFLSRAMDEMMLPSKIYEPASIVNIFRVRGITLFSESTDSIEDESAALMQAERIVEMGNITHSTPLQAFLVKSTSGSLHGVQLFPRESCSCSINQRCAHIMAVMLSLGMPLSCDKRGSIKLPKPTINQHPPLSATLDEQLSSLVDKNCPIVQSMVCKESSLDDTDLGKGEKEQVFIIQSLTGDSKQTALSEKEAVKALQQFSSSSAALQQVDSASLSSKSQGVENIPTTQPIEGFTSLAQMYGTARDVNGTDFQSMIHATSGNEVLMVVSGTEGGDKPMIAYEVSPETMMAFANQGVPADQIQQTVTQIQEGQAANDSVTTEDIVSALIATGNSPTSHTATIDTSSGQIIFEIEKDTSHQQGNKTDEMTTHSFATPTTGNIVSFASQEIDTNFSKSINDENSQMAVDSDASQGISEHTTAQQVIQAAAHLLSNTTANNTEVSGVTSVQKYQLSGST